jgi:hypothetical protein
MVLTGCPEDIKTHLIHSKGWPLCCLHLVQIPPPALHTCVECESLGLSEAQFVTCVRGHMCCAWMTDVRVSGGVQCARWLMYYRVFLKNEKELNINTCSKMNDFQNNFATQRSHTTPFI